MRDNWYTQLIGPQVRLIPYQMKFVDKYHCWMCDPYVLEMTASEPLTIEEEYEMQQTWLNDPHKCTFIIVQNDMKEIEPINEISNMVGDVNIFLHDRDDRTNAEIEIMIAEVQHRRKGYGREALLMMMKYGVEKLGITRYFAKINTENRSSISLFLRLGFVEVNYVAAFQEHEFELIVSSPRGQDLLAAAQFSIAKDYVPEE